MTFACRTLADGVRAVAPSFLAWDPTVMGPGIVLSNANTTASISTTDTSGVRSVTHYPWNHGDYRYVEYTCGAVIYHQWVGIVDGLYDGTDFAGFYYRGNGNVYGDNGRRVVNASTGVSVGQTFTAGDVVGLAIDCNLKKLRVFVNGIETALGDTRPMPGTGPIYLAFTPFAGYSPGLGTSYGTMNFGNTPFVYGPPVGYTGGW